LAIAALGGATQKSVGIIDRYHSRRGKVDDNKVNPSEIEHGNTRIAVGG
jgi:hypothetical protein